MVKRRRKTRTHLKGPNNSAATSTSAPKSFIIRTGKVPRSVSTLVSDTRKVMEPNTATRLRERNTNKLKDFISMAGPIGVTHLLIFGQTDAGTNLRILRAPRGPTLTFKVNKYALSRDVQASSRRPTPPGSEFVTPPLLVLNNFGGEERKMKLLVATFQNLFPPIQVQSMKLSQARRIVLLNYNSTTGTIDWRHYLISVRPVGVSKSVRRVIEGSRSTSRSSRNKLPNLSSTQDISDYVLGKTTSSSTSGSVNGEFETDASEAESEAEDVADPKNKVHLHDRYVGRGNSANTQKAVRLREIGPRMELKLVKIEEGCNEGAVLFHEYVKKSAREEVQLQRDHADKLKLQKQRREQQEENVERKKLEKAELRKASRRNAGLASDAESEADDEEASESEDEEDEFAYEDQFAVNDEEQMDDDEELFDDADASSDEQVADEDEDDSDDDDDAPTWNPSRNASGGYNNPPGVDPHSDESDLEPIPLGGMQHDYNSDQEWPGYSDDEPSPPPSTLKKTKSKPAPPSRRKKSRR
ncbi:Ribosome biogenesis protein SSF2 [Pseudozyma hubeiensis]|nr:Ribosome biogenesis protein SSF2 [Pseudozyma hubeiensis]